MLSTIKAVVFDLDGTLYDSRRLQWHLIVSDLSNVLTLRAERKARKRIAGKNFGDAIAVYRNLFQDISEQRDKTLDQIEDWYFDSYMPRMVRVLKKYYVARPFVKEVFGNLRARGIRVAVFSDYGQVEAKLEAIGIHPSWVDAVFDAPALGGLKPAPSSFAKVAEALGVAPSETLMVGDRIDTDGAGALACGMKFIHLILPHKNAAPEGAAYLEMSWEEVCDMIISRRQEPPARDF